MAIFKSFVIYRQLVFYSDTFEKHSYKSASSSRRLKEKILASLSL